LVQNLGTSSRPDERRNNKNSEGSSHGSSQQSSEGTSVPPMDGLAHGPGRSSQRSSEGISANGSAGDRNRGSSADLIKSILEDQIKEKESLIASKPLLDNGKRLHTPREKDVKREGSATYISLDTFPTFVLQHATTPARHSECLNKLRSLEARLQKQNPITLVQYCDIYAALIRILRNFSSATSAKCMQLFHELKGKLFPLQPNDLVYSEVMKTCAEHKDLISCKMLLHEVQQYKIKNPSATYEAAISAFAQQGQMDTCFDILDSMKNEGVTTTILSYRPIIIACAKAGKTKTCRKLLDMMKNEGLEPIEQWAIDVLAKSGDLKKFEDYVAQIPNLAALAKFDLEAILRGYALLKKPLKVILMWYQLEKERLLHPSHYTFLLQTFPHEGRQIIHEMRIRSLKPELAVYKQLFSAAGQNITQLQELYEMMKQDGVVPDSNLRAKLKLILPQEKLE